MLDPELRELQRKYDIKDKHGKSLNPEWFNDIKLDDITCKCPHKDKFEQLFDKENNQPECMVWTACRHTTLAAAKRQMKAAPTPEPEIADDFVKYATHLVEKEVGEKLKHFKYSVKDWMDHLSTTKQRALRHVINYYKGDITNIPKKELHNILNLHYTGILKEERQPLDGKPRMVCSIPQRTKYVMGPVTWALEEIFQDGLKGYCGGKNLSEMTDMVNEYRKLGFTQVYEGDGSAFDNTQDVSLKQLDRNIYQMIESSIYHVPKKEFHKISQALYKTMDIEYIEKGKKKPLMSYKILGTVFSGDCDTTLMNTTRMAMYNRYVNDKAGLVFGKDYVCFSKGDDFTLMYKPYVTKDFINRAYYRYFLKSVPDPKDQKASTYGIGQVLKFLEGGDLSIIKFCSLRAWFLDDTETSIFLTRDISKFLTLAKYSVRTKSYNFAQKVIYLRDIAYSLRINYKGIKFFENLANHYDTLADRIKQDAKITDKEIRKLRIRQKVGMKLNENSYDQQFISQLEKENMEDVGHRKYQYKMAANMSYWDFMKTIEKKHTMVLTQKQADYVSRQIELEIGEEIIKSMYDVGPNKKY